jgi:YHS domain-containing protein
MILANLIDRSVRVGRRTVVKGVAALALTVSIGAGTSHAGELVNAQADGVAMDGFDVVAYHTAGAPAKGIASRSVEYKGKTWLFSSAENASKFSADPERYAPRYNGWCSYAVSEGYGAEVDFVNGWAVLDGKLYLNWDEETRDALVDEQSKRIPQAKENWPSVHAGLQDGSVDMYTHTGEGVDIAHPQQLN